MMFDIPLKYLIWKTRSLLINIALTYPVNSNLDCRTFTLLKALWMI